MASLAYFTECVMLVLLPSAVCVVVFIFVIMIQSIYIHLLYEETGRRFVSSSTCRCHSVLVYCLVNVLPPTHAQENCTRSFTTFLHQNLMYASSCKNLCRIELHPVWCKTRNKNLSKNFSACQNEM